MSNISISIIDIFVCVQYFIESVLYWMRNRELTRLSKPVLIFLVGILDYFYKLPLGQKLMCYIYFK